MPRCIVSWIKANYVQPLGVEDLAEMADMGVSMLHHHFPAMTAMSPLQESPGVLGQFAHYRGIESAVASRLPGIYFRDRRFTGPIQRNGTLPPSGNMGEFGAGKGIYRQKLDFQTRHRWIDSNDRGIPTFDSTNK